MRSPGTRRSVVIGALVLLTLGCCLYTSLTAPVGADYAPGPPCRGCDYAGAPINALATGHIHRFFATQPFMGSFTLLLRAPAVAIARSFGAGELAQYRLGCLVCLLLSAVLAWVLVLMARLQGRQWLWVAVLLGLLMSGPVTVKALTFGHPEELVGAVLCVVAVVFAQRGRPLVAGISLGLALATKQWALLAVLPVLIVAPSGRWRLMGTTVGVAALFLLPMLIGDPSLFVAQNLQAGLPPSNTTFGVTATNVWFPYAKLAGVVVQPTGTSSIYHLPSTLDAITHPVAVAVGLGVSLIFWLRTRGLRSDDVLLLLALVFLLRCVLDPLTLSYHHMPFFVAMISFETLIRKRLPIISIYTAVAIWSLSHWVAPLQDASALNRIYLAWALPLVAYLGYRLFGPAAHRGSRTAGLRHSRGAAEVVVDTS